MPCVVPVATPPQPKSAVVTLGGRSPLACLRRVSAEASVDDPDLDAGAGGARRLPRTCVGSGDALVGNAFGNRNGRLANIAHARALREVPQGINRDKGLDEVRVLGFNASSDGLNRLSRG